MNKKKSTKVTKFGSWNYGVGRPLSIANNKKWLHKKKEWIAWNNDGRVCRTKNV